MRAKSLQSYPTLCAPMDCSRRDPLSMGLSRQEWVPISFSRGSSLRRDQTESLMSPASAGEFFTTSAAWSICCMPSSITSLRRQSDLTLITLVWNQAISSSSRWERQAQRGWVVGPRLHSRSVVTLSYKPILSDLEGTGVLITRLYCLPFQKTNQLTFSTAKCIFL